MSIKGRLSRNLCWFTDPDGNTVIMDAVTDYNYKLNSNATNSTLEDGSSVSDNIVMQNRVITVNGVVTDMVTSDAKPIDVRNAIEKSMTEKHVFDFAVDNYDFPTMKNCVILNASFSRNAQNTYGYSINMTIKQVRFVSQSQLVATTLPNPDYVDPLGDTKDVGSNTKQAVSSEEEDKAAKRLKLVKAIEGAEGRRDAQDTGG